MFGIGETELIIIVVFAFMIFGPDKLPGMGRTIGRALRQFREAQEGITQVVQAEVVDPLNNAMNEPSAKKKAEAAAQAAKADADIESDGDTAAPRRTETFAERKARLRAERDAREAARPAASETDGNAQAVAPAEEATPAPKPAETSAAALYAMPPRQRDARANDEADAPAAADASLTERATSAEDGKEAGEAE